MIIFPGDEWVAELENNKSGWSCLECDMKFAPNETLVKFSTHHGVKQRYCLPCSQNNLDILREDVVKRLTKLKEQLVALDLAAKRASRQTKRRRHIYVGRKLAGG